MERYNKLRETVAKQFSVTTQELVDKALQFATERMEGLTRYDGAPMLDHAAEVANIVATEVGLGRNSTLASILHDVVRVEAQKDDDEALEALLNTIRKEFGDEVIGIVMGLTSISELKLNTHSDQASNFRDMIVSYSEDPRVILIKLADRLEVMRSIAMFPEEKRKKKSWESLNLYAQIAHKLGLYNIKSELEDLSLSQLEPADHKHITDKLREGEKERLDFIERFVEPIRKGLDAAGI